jgi:hypothetical protein
VSGQLRAALAGALVMAALGGTTFAVAAGEGRPVLGGARNPSPDPAQALTRETEIIAETSTYGTRQSNKSADGGGAIYGCRSRAGGSERGNEPCVRASNLVDGRAFEFNANGGTEVGRITGPAAAAPFTTSARGVAAGLNADRVDSLDAEQIVALARMREGLDADTVDGAHAAELRTRWALVAEDGTIERQTGGFRIVDCYTTTPNCYLDAGEDVRAKGIHAQIAVQNVDAVDDPSAFSGEAGVAPCGAPWVACAPAATERPEVLVVAPRTSDGSPTAAGARLRFYVFVTGATAAG